MSEDEIPPPEKFREWGLHKTAKFIEEEDEYIRRQRALGRKILAAAGAILLLGVALLVLFPAAFPLVVLIAFCVLIPSVLYAWRRKHQNDLDFRDAMIESEREWQNRNGLG